MADPNEFFCPECKKLVRGLKRGRCPVCNTKIMDRWRRFWTNAFTQ